MARDRGGRVGKLEKPETWLSPLRSLLSQSAGQEASLYRWEHLQESVQSKT